MEKGNRNFILEAGPDPYKEFWFHSIQEPSDIIIFVSMFSIFFFVLLKLKFKMDLSGILTLLWLLIAALYRLISHEIYYSPASRILDNVMQVASNALIWISLCYFTFELTIIKSTIES